MKRMTNMKKALFTVALLIPAGNFAWGQTVVDESFEQSCSNSSNAFYTNCVSGWTSASGTPDNSSLLGSAYAGNKYAHLYAKFDGGCANNEGSEGILLNYNFQAGVTYKISYAIKGSKGINTASQTYFSHWLLTNGMPNQTGGNCTAGDLTPMVPSGSQTIHTPSFNAASWTVNQQTFVPNANFSQLWFRHFITSSVLNSSASATILIDKVVIEKICTVTPTISAGSSFCEGSPITLIGDYSPSNGCNVDNHIWTVVETDQYGNVVPNAVEWWSPWYSGNPGWFTIPSQGSGGPTMTCGKYYRVNLAIQNGNTPWAATSQLIYVNCPPAFSLKESVISICSGQPAGISIKMGKGSTSTYTMQVIPVSPAGPAVYTGPLASVQAYPTVSTVYSVSVTDNVTGCSSTQYVTVHVSNNDPAFSLYVNTTNPNYFTLDLDANDHNSNSNPGFYYGLIIEELGPGGLSYYQEYGTDCWWNYPLPETFQGFVSTSTGTYTQTPWGACPQPAGQFLYNHTYRITRVVGSPNCPELQFSMIIAPTKSAYGVEVYEDTKAPDYTKSFPRINGEQLDATVSISPNPGTGLFTISLSESAVKVAVYNLLGEEVTQFESTGSTATFDLSGKPKGVYLVKIQSETEQTTKKIVLE